eukprot:TRINITY_DN8521_c0_g1_i1.p1 TRINITY_DN8521_c0_g1~~TRINITY_DN8521_c0_g1_i1.p1  ORF type:complete len:320 (-),score=100.27 TRINITY_DN8521_c0_g1_i1:404-1312(-)
MDPVILIGVSLIVVVIAFIVFRSFASKPAPVNQPTPREQPAVATDTAEVLQDAPAARRSDRFGRMRQRAPVAAPAAEPAPQVATPGDDLSDEDDDEGPQLKKIGKKKQAKLDEKEQRRQQREAMEREREERKKREEQEEAERKEANAEQQRAEAERARLEEEELQRIRAERLKREQEEYDEFKKFMVVEKKGEVAADIEERKNRIGEFIDYVKSNKVVLLEELAAEFSMKTAEVIEQLEALDKEGSISGVIDDRGKFIYITREEMSKVAAFINRRGRVSIDDIARESNRLINLQKPETVSVR